jgi:N-acetylglucosaminyldiphosphoundecaprenol N-acetyl-beta-D-mannosaminyltransferase
MQKELLMNVPVSLGTWSSFVNKIVQLSKDNKSSSYVCLANSHMMVEAHKHADFKSILDNADIIAPDGKPLTWGLKLIHGISQQRIAGMELLPRLLKDAELNKVPVFFYGGTELMKVKAKDYLSQEYPLLSLSGFVSPPFRKLSDSEEEEYIRMINDSGARLLFVVLGCPKQEKWMASMKGRISVCMVGIGGALPVMIGMQKRAPEWMQQYGLEWFYRLIQEPKRLFKRYLVTNTLFIILLAKYFTRKRILHLPN